MSKVKDLTGKRFGRLTVLDFAFIKKRRAYWRCLCDCGNKTATRGISLTRGDTRSCGCLRTERNTKHGMSESPEYRSWQAMLDRCRRKGNIAYKHYGARGITVCAGWQEFKNFIADMGHKPSSKHSIDRIDNDGGYWCGHCEECIESGHQPNCRWATTKQQMRNMRNNRMLTHGGRAMCVKDWAIFLGVDPRRLHQRLTRGWSVEKTLTTPIGPTRRMLTHRGKTQSVTDWASEIGIPRTALYKRIYAGWTTERALTEPVIVGRNQFTDQGSP